MKPSAKGAVIGGSVGLFLVFICSLDGNGCSSYLLALLFLGARILVPIVGDSVPVHLTWLAWLVGFSVPPLMGACVGFCTALVVRKFAVAKKLGPPETAKE